MPNKITAYIRNMRFAHQKMTYVKPVAHHYEQPGEPEYIKYTCPICDLFGNKHQVHKSIDINCPLCHVNLIWIDNPEDVYDTDGEPRYTKKEINFDVTNEREATL